MLTRLQDLLARRRAPLWLGALAVLLCAPALSQGLQADDVSLARHFQHGAAPWALFEFSEADAVADARARGSMVWWSNPDVSANFFRPLASLTHALDFHLWPHAPWAMHLLNALLYGLSVTLAALLYRRLAAVTATAALAALLFAIDDGHAVAATWIASRNTLLALVFSLLALWLHVLWRQRKRPWLGVASAVAVCAALLSAEAGVWAVALLVSFALVYEEGSFAKRLESVALPALVTGAWAVAYLALGFGFRGSSFYRDPSSPSEALVQGLMDLPVWTVAQFGPGVHLFPYLAPLTWVRLVCLPVAVLLLWWLLPSLRRSRACRFFALACVLCMAPLLFTVPNTRVLLGPSFGAMGWIACVIQEGRSGELARERWGARTMVAFHVWLAGLLFVPTVVNAFEPTAYGARTLSESIETSDEVVLVGSPFELLANYTLHSMEIDAEQDPPSGLHTLYAGGAALRIVRVDDRTLEIEPDLGWGHVLFERVFCAAEALPDAGAEVVTPAFTARVLSTNAAGMPQRVRFTFPTVLEMPGRQWLTWQGTQAVSWTPPAVGKEARLPAVAYPSALTP